MGNRILTSIGWEQRIRDKIGVDDAYLPDTALQQPDCITIAEANIIAQIPTYTAIAVDTDSRAYLEYAVVLECCILLCPSMSTRLPKKETGEHASYELGTDWTMKKVDLVVERNEYIMKILNILFPTNTPSISSFIVTYPKREGQL